METKENVCFRILVNGHRELAVKVAAALVGVVREAQNDNRQLTSFLLGTPV